MKDTLPDLQSDADVDALLARIHARVQPAATPPPPAAVALAPLAAAAPHDTFAAFASAYDGFAATMVRALEVMAASLEELEADAVPAAPPRGVAPQPSPSPAVARTRSRKGRRGVRP